MDGKRTEGDVMELIAQSVQSLEEFLDLCAQAPEGVRYEAVDGRAVVVPSPHARHQSAVFELGRVLADAAPHLRVLPAPLDWVLWRLPSLSVRQPDLVVVTPDQIRAPRLTQPPVLVVEVLSPESVERDTVTKRREYARAGAQHYWIVDPTVPQIVVLRLDADDAYREVARATGTTPLHLTDPFPVTLVASSLTAAPSA
jgi:Uma2 family endonuclease